MREYPGFVFWGLFAVFGAVTMLYYLWMRREDRKDKNP